MSGGESRKVSKLLELVQKRVEQCLHHYMNKREVINALSVHDNVEPFITDLVWQKLEEQNKDFFKAYYVSLLVKDQILEFNRLLSEQLVLMYQSGSLLASNGSHISPTQQQISTSFAAQNIDILSQNLNIGVAQTMNGIKPEAGCYAAGSSPFHYSPPPSNFPDSRQLIGDASFGSVEANAQHINETLLDNDDSSYGFWEPIPSSFNFPELRADFSNVSESYYGQSYVAKDVDNSMDPSGVVQRFDPSSENLRHQRFNGD